MLALLQEPDKSTKHLYKSLKIRLFITYIHSGFIENHVWYANKDKPLQLQLWANQLMGVPRLKSLLIKNNIFPQKITMILIDNDWGNIVKTNKTKAEPFGRCTFCITLTAFQKNYIKLIRHLLHTTVSKAIRGRMLSCSLLAVLAKPSVHPLSYILQSSWGVWCLSPEVIKVRGGALPGLQTIPDQHRDEQDKQLSLHTLKAEGKLRKTN